MTISNLASQAFYSKSLYTNTLSMTRSMRNLSSGYRVNSAADDAAALAVSERMRGQYRGMNMATQNATHATNLIQTAEGGLSSSADALTRMQELAVQASNATLTDSDRKLLDIEMQSLKDQLNYTASNTNYNGIKLLDGSLSGKNFQVGASGSSSQRFGVTVGDMSAAGLGLADISIATVDGANSALDAVKSASEKLTAQRSSLGATQNRLESTIKNLGTSTLNLYESESALRDADMATELMNFTRSSILQQSTLAMQAQSMNLQRSYALGLLLR